ncbi:CarD family transcriptional regulator [Actinoplanes sp. NPDC051346]|uniref:CarD family transcriptional regulator n=1 Tax=Actinoplanes sp. NPDC051346 TaxID=3155048 RepID=UPI00342F42DD
MGYKVGDLVACAGQGAGAVREIVTRRVGGVEREFVVLPLSYVTVTMPADSSSLADLRGVVGPDGVEGVLRVLAAPDPGEPSASWGEQDLMIRLGVAPDDYDGPVSHESAKVAEVVRTLTHRQRRAGLAFEERGLLFLARNNLASHIAAYLGLTVERAERLIDDALAGTPTEK